MSPTNLSTVPRCCEHHGDHAREQLIQLGDDVFRRALFRHRREAANVGEQHRHVAARAAERGERRIRDELLVDVLRDVAREQLLDLALLAPFDEVLPGEIADDTRTRAPASGTVTGIQVPRAKSATDCQASSAAATSATAPVSHAFRNAPATPTIATAAITRRDRRPSPARASIDRFDRNASTRLACTSGPLISPCGNGVVNTSFKPFGGAADDDDAILEERGIDARLLPFDDLLLRIEDVVERVRREGRLAVAVLRRAHATES